MRLGQEMRQTPNPNEQEIRVLVFIIVSLRPLTDGPWKKPLRHDLEEVWPEL